MNECAQTRTVVALGLAQTLAWASSSDLPAMLAAPMARDLGLDGRRDGQRPARGGLRDARAPVRSRLAQRDHRHHADLTIAKGTLPLVPFGPLGYGARQGWLMLPARVTQAMAPLLFGLVLDRLQAGALWLTTALGLAALAALLWLRSPASATARSHTMVPERSRQ